MPPSFKIVEISNCEDILALYPEAGSEQLEKIRLDIENDLEKAKKDERIVFGAKVDGKTIGTVQLVFRCDKEIYTDGQGRAHIHHARVAENFRGKGIGTGLMKEAEKEAKERGFSEITVSVDEDNLQAMKLYKRLGYYEFIREKGKRGEPLIGMLKTL